MMSNYRKNINENKKNNVIPNSIKYNENSKNNVIPNSIK